MFRYVRSAIALLAFGSSLSLATHTFAASLTLFVGGQQVGYYHGQQLGCTGDGVITTCRGSGLVVGDLRLDSWDMFFDNDPVVSGTVAVTNNSAINQQFTFLFNLPVAPIVPSTLIGGSMQGGMTDNTGNDATVSTVAGSSLYTALIDGAPVQTLYPHPQAFSAGGAFLSGNIPNVAFGTPIPSQPGPAVAGSIEIRLDFGLTAGDSASFTSNFVVQVVPEPAAVALLSLGLVGLAFVSRRRRS